MGYRLEGSVEASLVLGHHGIRSWGRDQQSGVATVSLGFVPYGPTGAPPSPSKRKDLCKARGILQRCFYPGVEERANDARIAHGPHILCWFI